MLEKNMTLRDLFEEVRDMDISDPSALTYVFSYLEELNEETECYMKMLVKKLENAVITWEQPWYQLSTCLTRPFKEPADAHEEQYEMGTMTKDEIDHIAKNWRKFIKKFDVPDKLICLARWRNKELNQRLPEEKARVFVIAYLARGLKRTMSQIYKHIVSYYGGCNKGQYSKDEEKVMGICFHHCPKKAVTILSTVLAREPRGIYKRLYFTTNGKPSKRRLKWNLDRATKFVNLLMEYTDEPLEGLKNKKIDKSVWLKLEQDFEKQQEYLQHFWNTTLHCQLFIKCHFTLRKLRRCVFKVLRSSSFKVWPDIRWKEVVSKFPDGFTHKFLYWTTIRVFKKFKTYSKTPLQELVDYGLDITRSKYPRRNCKLRTLTLNEYGHLEEIYYKDKLKISFF